LGSRLLERPVAEQLGDLLSRGWGVIIRLLDAANSNTVEGFLQHGREANRKNCAVVAGFRRFSALPNEQAQTTDAPEKSKQKQTINKKHLCKLRKIKNRSAERLSGVASFSSR
jgi:hypothetical protein